jgi:hypothetical protein
MYYGNLNVVSNRADWQEVFVLTDEDTGDLIDISGCDITLSVACCRPSYLSDGYGFGGPVGVILTGSTDTGEVTLPDVGTFQFIFTKDRMASLCQGEYQIGIRISQDDRTVQLFAGTVKVQEGVDMQ